MSSYREGIESGLRDKAYFVACCTSIFDFVKELWNAIDSSVYYNIAVKQGIDGQTDKLLYFVEGQFKSMDEFFVNNARGNMFLNNFYDTDWDIDLHMLGLPDTINKFFMTLKYCNARNKFNLGGKQKIYISIKTENFSKFQSQLTIENFKNFLNKDQFDL